MSALPILVLLGLFLGFSATINHTKYREKGWKSIVSKETITKCGLNQVFVNHTMKVGWVPLVNLGEECDFTLQCRPSNSFCGSTIDSDNLICLCSAGHETTLDGISCFPRKKCSNENFNSAMVLSDDCGPNQFCRKKICLCAANYKFDRNGICISDERQMVEIDFEDYLDRMNRKQNLIEAKIESGLGEVKSLCTTLLALSCILLAIILLIFGTFLYIVKKHGFSQYRPLLLNPPQEDAFVRQNPLYRPLKQAVQNV